MTHPYHMPWGGWRAWQTDLDELLALDDRAFPNDYLPVVKIDMTSNCIPELEPSLWGTGEAPYYRSDPEIEAVEFIPEPKLTVARKRKLREKIGPMRPVKLSEYPDYDNACTLTLAWFSNGTKAVIGRRAWTSR